MKLLIKVTGLVAVGLFFAFQIGNLSAQISVLKTNINNWQISYNKLETYYDTTLNNYNLLDANHGALQSNFNALNTELQTLTVKHDELSADYKTLQSDYNKLQNETRDFKQLLNEYENVPHSYYSSGDFYQRPNTYDDLCYFLTVEFVLPKYYKLDVFDCSESTAYVEWALENAGFDAEILVGPTPWDTSSGYHAWVMAYTNERQVAIEATLLTNEIDFTLIDRIPGIIYEGDDIISDWSNYYHGYDNAYQNIYHAIRDWGNPKEWNWWDGLSGLE